ncbi:metal ABC transporter substrate-binding protein [Georgenia alba]|uniref:Metal ABC transporter substrate-binding protein n=1 Tax=Georgenia alba TaxID=2233858 RepID=A0ABW2QA48_9MICO
MNVPRRPLLAVSALSALALTACSGAAGGGPDAYAALYPLQLVASEVAGDHLTVEPITPAGTDPHDLELSTAAVAGLEGSYVVYLSGFQPALDDALDVVEPARVLDVSNAAHVHGEEAAGEHGEHGEHGHEGHDHEGTDPHFWLDPLRLADVADAVAADMSEMDPDHAEDYAANAERLRGELEDLDAEYSAALQDCESRTIVAAHEAYGYLAERYGLEQAGISGVDPESEPSPARMAEIREVVQSSGVETIYTESLVNPAVAESLADDLGIEVDVLNPLETAPEEGTYLDAMRANLDALTTGLRCA